MTIVLTGGGSGGHITPLLAVAHELKRQTPDLHLIYIGQRGDKLGDIPAQNENIDQVHTVWAGKFRRYHGEGLRQLLDIPTVVKNVRDAFLVLIGIWQCFWLLKRIRPSVIFVKGGFVGVPVGLAAAMLHIPFVTHDSDALPGLANRIIAPWASRHAVALPKEIYSQYPADKTLTVGIPVSHVYHPVTMTELLSLREQVGIPGDAKVLLVTGGGLGAQRLNNAISACAAELLDRYKDLYIVQIAGRANEAELRQYYQKQLASAYQQRVIVRGFVTNLHVYSGAATIVVTRAGATSIAEFAAQHKPCVVVPNPFLTGGHQLKNAKVLADRKSIRIVDEVTLGHDDHALMPAIVDLLDHPAVAHTLGEQLAKLAQPDSAQRLAMLLLEIANVTPKTKTI